MNHPLRFVLASAIVAAYATSVQAADDPSVTISGFGTAALTRTDTDDAQYSRPNQANGANKSAQTGTDSNFGVQATARMNDSLSFTAQGLVRKYGREHYGAELSLAFAKLKVNDDFSVRAGRIGLPVYMVSDFRSVGYANTMLRPSTEVYSQVVADVMDGADVIYQHSFGDTTVTAQLGYGVVSTRLPHDAKSELKKNSAFNVIAENGPFTVRFGRSDTRITLVGIGQLNGLLGALRQVGLGKVADDLDITDVRGSFTSLGFTMDYKNFLVQSEYAVRHTASRALIGTTSYYTMLGYRMGKVTPYYYYGNTKQDTARTYEGLPTAGPLAGLAAGVNFVIQAPLQSSHALGVRWDFYKSAAFKAQIDHVIPRDGAGTFINAKPGFKGPVNVVAAGIDFVF